MKILGIDPKEGSTIDKIIDFLKTKSRTSLIEEYKKQYDVSSHDVFDEGKKPDKKVKIETGYKSEKVNRIGLAFQERIVETAVSFAFGNPVNIVCQAENKDEEAVLKAVKKILEDCKIDSFNRKVATELGRTTEVAEIWFTRPEQESHKIYGFDTKYKLKSKVVTPWTGDALCPFFDEYGNLVAFGRGYTTMRNEVAVECFDIYTDEEIGKFEKAPGGTGWTGTPVGNVIKKIPVIYANSEKPDWKIVQKIIERLEDLLSKFGDTNDYFGAPMIFLKGEVSGLSAKGESGKVLQGGEDTEAEYLSWQHAPESVKLEIEILFKIIYSFTQTPDISFETLKSLNQVTGIGLKMLFMDAHLKVQKKREIFDEYLQRRMNVIKAFVSLLSTELKPACESISIKCEIVPFMIDDIASQIDNLFTANGGKALISQQTAIEKSGLVTDSVKEWKRIQEEAIQDIGESVE